MPAFCGAAQTSGGTPSSPRSKCSGSIRASREPLLRRLAATQAVRTDDAADAEPGKIPHEARHGEMADLGEAPFGRYYGSVDSTPVFLMLAGHYPERTRAGRHRIDPSAPGADDRAPRPATVPARPKA